MSSISSHFKRPLLIYDDKCYSCTKFAHAASVLSTGWIKTAGHHYSQEARDAKNIVFPPGYDSTKMFWLINRHGAFGARSGLLQVVREVGFGIIRGHKAKSNFDYSPACEYAGEKMSCYSSANTLRRIARLLSHGATFRF
jgi:hypothetical protein